MIRSGRRAAIAIAAVATSGLASPRAARADAGDTCISAYESAQQERRDGAFVRAREELALCRGACPAALAKDCESWMADVEASVAHAAFDASLDGRAADPLRITIDDVTRPVSRAPIDLDPGTHVVRVEAAGGARGETRFSLTKGERRRVAVALVEPPGEGFSPPTSAIVLAALGGTAMLAGAGLGIAGHLERSNLLDTCAPDCDQSDVDAIQTTWIAGGAVAGAGLLALAGAIVWTVIDAGSTDVETGLAARPAARSSGASLLYRF